MFADEDMKEAEAFSNLGPAYFDAQRVTRNFMEKFEAVQFKPLIEKLAKEVNDRLWNDLENHILSDTELNVQGQIWRMVDNSVEALLSGNEWAMKRYLLSDRYNAEKIRETVAKLIPAELQDKRVADLEKEVDRLCKDLDYYKNH